MSDELEVICQGSCEAKVRVELSRPSHLPKKVNPHCILAPILKLLLSIYHTPHISPSPGDGTLSPW